MIPSSRGAGLVAIPVAALALVLGIVLANVALDDVPFGDSFIDSEVAVVGIFCFTGLVVFVLGFWLNEPRTLVLDIGDDGRGGPDPSSADEISYSTKNSIYWIKIEYWGVLIILATLFVWAIASGWFSGFRT